MSSRNYFDVFMSASRINKLFLDVLKSQLDCMEIIDLNAVQAVIIYNIGKSKLSIGDVINKGYYIGSNVSYNIKKMIDSGYICQETSEYDKRISQIKLTEKGVLLYEKIHSAISNYNHFGKDGVKLSEHDVDVAFKKMLIVESALNAISKA